MDKLQIHRCFFTQEVDEFSHNFHTHTYLNDLADFGVGDGLVDTHLGVHGADLMGDDTSGQQDGTLQQNLLVDALSKEFILGKDLKTDRYY